MDYLYFLQNLREQLPSFVNYFFVFISETSTVAAVLLAGVIYWSYEKKTGQWILMNFAGGLFVSQLLKNIFCISRPWILDKRLHVAKEAASTATGYSFPSTHTANATSVFFSIACWKRHQKKLTVFCILYVLLVAFSRNWLGAHTLSDVLVGILSVSSIIIVNLLLFNFMDSKSKSDIIVSLCLIVLVTAAFIYMNLKSYEDITQTNLKDVYSAFGVTLGVIIGFIIERHFINFLEPENSSVKTKRAVAGIVFTVLMFLCSSIFSNLFGENLGHCIKYFLVVIFITVIYPLVFTKWEKNGFKIRNF